MPDSNYYNRQIKSLLGKGIPEMNQYGVPDTLMDVPDWLQTQSEEGLGRETEGAMYRLGIHGQAGQFQDILRTIAKNEGMTGIGGGFSDQMVLEAEEGFETGKANLEFDIGQKSDQTKLQALREMLGIEQFNKEMTFNFQNAMAGYEMQKRQMKLSELIAQRDIEAQRELEEDSAWIDVGAGILGLATSFIPGL